MHWSQHYIGNPYDEANDCAAFAERVQREVFDREVHLPSERAEGLRGQTAQIRACVDCHGELTELPADGDAVLLIGRGRLNHIGIYCLINGVPYVLHAMKSAGQVVLHKVRELDRHGLTIEGFYKWR